MVSDLKLNNKFKFFQTMDIGGKHKVRQNWSTIIRHGIQNIWSPSLRVFRLEIRSISNFINICKVSVSVLTNTCWSNSSLMLSYTYVDFLCVWQVFVRWKWGKWDYYKSSLHSFFTANTILNPNLTQKKL